MILAAGQGTRVRPLTKNLPKPMVPILNKPVLEYLIEHLAKYGIREIMINVAFNHYKIENYFGDGHRWGVEIGYSYEGKRDHGEIVPKAMGSAGGMRKIQDFGGFFDETTLVMCGDAIVDLDIRSALEEHRHKGALASVVGGLVACPVIATPTSVGYGASFGGLAALLAMLNSCATGVAVVNIDNGFGAGYMAALINELAYRNT